MSPPGNQDWPIYALQPPSSSSTSTASTYRTRLMEKLKVTSTAELIRLALEHDITG